MARIKVNSSELESAYRHSKTLVSKCEDVGSMVRSVINGMDDSSFSAKAGIMSDLHGISTRLNKQAELMRQYGAIIRTIENEMQAADSSFGAGSNSIWGNVKSWVGSTAKKILPFSTSSVLGKQNKTASVFLATSSAAIATSVGKIIRDWLKQIFGRIFHNGEASGGTSESTGGASSEFTNTDPIDYENLEIKEVKPCWDGASWDIYSEQPASIYTESGELADNYSYVGYPEGQCTWYCYGRFLEKNGVELERPPRAGNANTWLSANEGRDGISVVYGADKIVPNSVAVSKSDAGGYGHVCFVEHITYNEEGFPSYVYFTEANVTYSGVPRPHGELKGETFESFLKDKRPDGYISKSK